MIKKIAYSILSIIIAILLITAYYIAITNKPTIESIEVKTTVQSQINNEENLLLAVSFLNPNVDEIISKQIIKAVIEECDKVYLPPLLILCIINEESKFDQLAVNKSGAKGLMQVITKYHPDKVENMKPNEVFFIKNNISIGIRVFKEYFNEYGNIINALQKYVGATTKDNAREYIENIISNYLTIEAILYEKVISGSMSEYKPYQNTETKKPEKGLKSK